jgi:hypothetical protein
MAATRSCYFAEPGCSCLGGLAQHGGGCLGGSAEVNKVAGLAEVTICPRGVVIAKLTGKSSLHIRARWLGFPGSRDLRGVPPSAIWQGCS